MTTTHTYNWTSLVVFWLNEETYRRAIYKAVPGILPVVNQDHIEYAFNAPITDGQRRIYEEAIKKVLPPGTTVEWRGTVTTVAPTSITFTR